MLVMIAGKRLARVLGTPVQDLEMAAQQRADAVSDWTAH